MVNGHIRPGQALAIAGPRGGGKSLFQNLITEILAGRSAKAYRYMAERTEFNSELLGAEHLMVEDDVASTDMRKRQAFGTKIKEIAVNENQSCHAKHRNAIGLKPFWRLTISVNDAPEHLLILPPMDDGLADKLMLLKAGKSEMPMPTGTQEQRREFRAALSAELPAFVFHLRNWKIPDALRCERFGVKHYHHPRLLEAIEELSPEVKLLSLIDTELFSARCDSTVWEGSAEDLEKDLHNSPSGYTASRLLSWNNAAGTYLGRLAAKHPERGTAE